MVARSFTECTIGVGTQRIARSDSTFTRLCSLSAAYFESFFANYNAPDDIEKWTAIRVRLGQPQFRSALLLAYRSRCAISGCSVLQLLEAAHIKPYSDRGDYAVSNGILLRTDLHTLFDRGLLKIDPTTRTVRIDKSVKDPAYRALHKKGIFQPIAERDKIQKSHLVTRSKQAVRLSV